MSDDFDYENMTPENLRHAASVAAEAVRYMNHATLIPGALRYPSDVDAVLVDLETLAQRFPQLLGQLAAWLVTECKANRVHVENAPPVHSPSVEAQAVAMVRRYLNEAGAEAAHVAASLHDARQITAKLKGVPDEGEQADG